MHSGWHLQYSHYVSLYLVSVCRQMEEVTSSKTSSRDPSTPHRENVACHNMRSSPPRHCYDHENHLQGSNSEVQFVPRCVRHRNRCNTIVSITANPKMILLPPPRLISNCAIETHLISFGVATQLKRRQPASYLPCISVSLSMPGVAKALTWKVLKRWQTVANDVAAARHIHHHAMIARHRHHHG